MTDEVFNEQKGKNPVDYVGDIVVKSDKKESHLADLHESFANLKKSGVSLIQKNVSSTSKKESCLAS